jgi:hypothetical protein
MRRDALASFTGTAFFAKLAGNGFFSRPVLDNPTEAIYIWS